MAESHESIFGIVEIDTKDPKLTWEQLKRLFAKTGGLTLLPLTPLEGSLSKLPSKERERQTRLAMPVHELFQLKRSDNHSKMIPEGLYRKAGPQTVRDVLVWGERAMGEVLGAAGMERLREGLRAGFANERLLAKPTPVDIARFCISAEQVTAGVIPSFRRCARRTRPFTQLGNDMRSMSVLDLLRDFAPGVQGAIGGHQQDIRVEALHFVQSFADARKKQ